MIAPDVLTESEIAQIRSAEPRAALELITEKRQLGTLWQFARVRMEKEQFHRRPLLRRLFRPSPRLAPVTEQMFRPVNPNLLCTAIALLRTNEVAPRSVEMVLQNYARGLSVPNIEQFLSLGEQCEPDSLLRVLAEEDGLVDALEELGLAVLLEDGPLMTNRVVPNFASKWDVRMAAWCRVNSIAIGPQNRKKFWEQYAIPYGFRYEKDVHSAREGLELALKSRTSKLNAALAARASDLPRTAQDQKATTLCLKRVFRIYQWLPHEIDACSAEVDFYAVISQSGLGIDNQRL